MQQNTQLKLQSLQQAYQRRWGYVPVASDYQATSAEFLIALEDAINKDVELNTLIKAKQIAEKTPNNILLQQSLKNSTSGTKPVGKVEAMAKGRQDKRATENLKALRDGAQYNNIYGQVVHKDNQIKTVQSNKNLGKTRRAVIVRQNQERRRSPLLRIANFASYVAVGLVAVFLGIFAGNMFVAARNRTSYDFDEALYTPDWQKVYASTYGKFSPENASAADAYVTAEYMLLANSEQRLTYQVEGTGYVAAKVMGIVQKQTVTKHIVMDTNQLMLESLTDGLIPAAEKTLYDLSNNCIDSYQSKSVSTTNGITTANYDSKPTKTYNLSQEEEYAAYRKEYGITPYVIFPYLVSDKTIDEETLPKQVENGWEFTITLNNLTGVMNYVYYMMHISGLTREPTFYELKLTFVVDEDFRLQSLYIYESYQIYYMGLPAECTAESTYIVTYND